MNETQKILYAKNYIDKMANGQNPLTDAFLPEDDLLNNVKITRCLFYVSSLLQELVELKSQDSTASTSSDTKRPFNKAKRAFEAPKAAIDAFPYDRRGMYARDIAEYFNAATEKLGMRKVYTTAVYAWLTQNGYLLDVESNGISYKTTSGKGKAAGITSEPRKDKDGKYYTSVRLGVEAQKIVVTHIDEIAAMQVFGKKSSTPYKR